MKNTIKYYYGIDADELINDNDDYYFGNYCLMKYYKNLDINLYNFMLENNIKMYHIIYNKDKQYITYIDNKPYILFKIFDSEKLSLDLIMNYNIKAKIEKKSTWADLWSQKIDYYENNFNNVKDENILKYFDYYVGMCENAISLYHALNINNDNYYVCHIRLNKVADLYNPLNFIIDYKVRDIAEYIKNEFFENKSNLEFIYNLLSQLPYDEAMLFFIRLMYPSYFFDNYDNYMKNIEIDPKYINKIIDYENFLKLIYRFLKNRYRMPNIEWLN